MQESNDHRLLFNEGGCCAEDALQKLCSGSLDKAQSLEVESHLRECDLCRETAEGMTRDIRMNNPGASGEAAGSVSQQVDESAQSLPGSGKPGPGRFWIFFTCVMVLFVITAIMTFRYTSIRQQEQSKPGIEMEGPLALPGNHPPLSPSRPGAAAAEAREKTTASPVQPAKAGEIFNFIEEMPQFPGGEEAMLKFLQENLAYPEAAREDGIQGKVFLTFVVETDGSLTDMKAVSRLGGGCDGEALRVLKIMPKWIPGRQRGVPVRVRFNLPVKFTLQ
ncbi:MAG: energy transducer TonB [Bacteroidota bacterium]